MFLVRRLVLALGFIWVGGFASAAVHAQSLSGGALNGVVTANNGEPVGGAQVTLESSDKSAIRTVETGSDGGFAFSFLPPGSYSILVEQVGYQPVRRLGITVRAGQRAAVRVAIERKPPPIVSVTEVDAPVVTTGLLSGRLVAAPELRDFDRFRDLTDAMRGTSSFVAGFDSRSGFGRAGFGAPTSAARLYVDGLPEPLFGHPGVPGLAPEVPAYSRGGLDQVLVFGSGFDSEWRPSSGPIVAAETRTGTNRIAFEPYARFSTARLGTATADNPADSLATSFAVGGSLRGSFKPDTGFFGVAAEYRSEELPSANPWSVDAAQFRGGTVPLAATLAAIANDSFGTNIAGSTSPTVRTWKGGNGLARIDFRIGRRHAFAARAGFASWKETNPSVALDAANDAGTALDARDISVGASLTSLAESYANEARIGISSGTRTWTGPALPATTLAAEGVRVGGSAYLPGAFKQRVVSVTEAFQIARGFHSFKFGATLDFGRHEQNWRYGASGVSLFGDLDQFAAGRGLRAVTNATLPNAAFNVTDVGLFVEDVWTLSAEFQVVLGLRYDRRKFATGKLGLNQDWLKATGLSSNEEPDDPKGIAPRVGFVWDVQGAGEWVVRGGAGLFNGGLDPRYFAEAMTTTAGVTVQRSFGVATWPAGLPTGATSGAALSFFTDKFRAPRTAKAEIGIEGVLGGGVSLQLSGGYYHTDYLPRRLDLNRPASRLGLTTEGRPLYGRLAQSAGLVYAVPGSNRRFADFDLVSAFVPTGAADHYEATVSIERPAARGLSVQASYTFSKTTDNLVGLLSSDPADQLSPFPEALPGVTDWSDGRSDLDVPHRVAAGATYRTRGGLSVLARWRARSGLPYTAGFRPGVDVNGDGGGGNDPAFLDPGIGNLAEALARGTCSQAAASVFAERNGCRGPMVQSVDVGIRLPLPVRAGGGRRVVIAADAFNVVSTTAGVVDRALFLVDPAGSLSGSGPTRLPLTTNPNFGLIHSRRGESRLVRFGLSIEY